MRASLLSVGLVFAATALADAPARKLSLAGEWIWGEGGDPPPGPVRYSLACGQAPGFLRVAEHGAEVEASLTRAKPMEQGAKHALPPFARREEERLHGTFDGSVLTLVGTHDVVYTATSRSAESAYPRPAEVHEPVRVELRPVERSGHLVGTRNGVTMWAARGSFVKPRLRNCPP